MYYFLPVALICYFLAPKAIKNGVLLVFSLIFYAWGEPKYVILMIATICLFYLCGLAIEKAQVKFWKKCWLILSIVLGVGALGIFKYGDFFLNGFNRVTGLSIPLLRLALPVGISFYTFQSLSYTIDVYRGEVPAQKSLLRFATYVALFPQLIAGPIVRYRDIARQLEDRIHSLADFFAGFGRFLIGLGKKILLADQFALLISLFRQSQSPSVLFYWMYAIAAMLQIYFDFSGYSDMAIGLGQIFGFRFPENFNYPYISRSITEFWRRWHISLGSWFRDYVYIPMGGNRVRPLRWAVNILTVWMLTGLWHGAAWNFVFWGLLFGILLLIEKKIPLTEKLPNVLRHGYVLLVVCISFVLFSAEDLRQAGSDLSCMFGFGNIPLFTEETVYYLRSFGVLFALGILGSTPLAKKTAGRIAKTPVGAVLTPLALGILLLLCTAYLVDGSFSPFLYFRF